MSKKISISLIVIFLGVLFGFVIWKIAFKNNALNNNSNNLDNETINNVNLSAGYVKDDCINEWDDYAKTIEEEIKTASAEIVDENTRYLVKNVNGYIYIYYLDNSNEEKLYRKTEISTEYLSQQDLDDLDVGIEVIGSKELNQLIENYE